MLTVYMDDQLIYSYQSSSDTKYGKSPGSAWNFINLPKDYMGKEITFVISSPYKEYANVINPVYYGTQTSHFLFIFEHYGISAIVASTLIVMGLGILLFYVIYKRKNETFKSVCWLGSFFLTIGIWILGESRLIQLIYNNPKMIVTITLISFYMIPIFFSYYIVYAYQPLRQQLLRWLGQAYSLFLLVVLLLQLFNIRDLVEWVYVYNVSLFMSSVTVLWVVLSEMRRNSNLRVFLAAIIVLVVSAAADMMRYEIYPQESAATFTQFGVIVLAFSMMVNMGNDMIELTYTKAKVAVLQKIAYLDSLTGLGNRTAYQQEMKRLEAEELKDISFAMFDIDGLKRTNDELGHEAGDCLIKSSAECLEQAFGHLGSLYRIGGDEFVLIMKQVDETQFKEACKKSAQEMQAYNKKKPAAKMSVSIGWADYEENHDQSIADILRRADDRMYMNKEKRKEANREVYSMKTV